MKFTLIMVGKTDVKWVKEGLELYAGRLSHYIQFTINEIPELKNASALSRDQIKEKEGDLILGLIRPADDVILLDEHGKEFRSVELHPISRTRWPATAEILHSSSEGHTASHRKSMTGQTRRCRFRK